MNGLRVFGDPVLLSSGRPVEQFGSSLAELAQHMQAVMRAYGGLGLAAPQVGSLQRLILVPGPEEGKLLALANPRWRSLGEGAEPGLEGCLSLPGLQLPVLRERSIFVEGHDLDGEQVGFETSGLTARVVQHECDHLDGILLLQRTDPSLRWMALKMLLWPREAQAEIVPSRSRTARV